MNAHEQRNHKTVTAELASGFETFAAAAVERFDRVDLGIAQTRDFAARAVNEERTHRLALAEQQRSYVDREDKALRDEMRAFHQRGFWSRLNWLLTGR